MTNPIILDQAAWEAELREPLDCPGLAVGHGYGSGYGSGAGYGSDYGPTDGLDDGSKTPARWTRL